MIIEEVTIENFKSIKNLTVKLKKINILYGDNNVGKSNILQALDFALNYHIDITLESTKVIELVERYFY